MQQLAALIASLAAVPPGDGTPNGPAAGAPPCYPSTVLLAFFCKELECASSGRGTLTEEALAVCWGAVSAALRQLALGEMCAALQWLMHGGPHPVVGMTPLDPVGGSLAIHLTHNARQVVISDVIAALVAALREPQVCLIP